MAVELTHPLVMESPGVVGFMFDAAPQHPYPVATAWIVIQIRLEDPAVVRVGFKNVVNCASLALKPVVAPDLVTPVISRLAMPLAIGTF